MGVEILEQCPAPARVFIPIGGGGLVDGSSAAIKLQHPATRVIGVEPVGAAAMLASRGQGHAVTLDRSESIADGLLPVRPGDLTFAHTQAYVDDIVTVTDAEIAAAVHWLFGRAHLVVEPSGAASLAALQRFRANGDAEGTSVAVLSGGNVALETLASLGDSLG